MFAASFVAGTCVPWAWITAIGANTDSTAAHLHKQLTIEFRQQSHRRHCHHRDIRKHQSFALEELQINRTQVHRCRLGLNPTQNIVDRQLHQHFLEQPAGVL